MAQLLVSKRLRAAVVGVGSMGRNHARVYSELDGIDLVALADSDDSALHTIANRYHACPYVDYREMLAGEPLDLVSVAVPTGMHAQVAAAAIRRGVNVLVEKPLASTLAEGQELIALAQERGVLLGVGHVERFNPVVTALKQHLDDGELGRVFQITIRRVGPFPARVKDVGVFLDLATHDIDVMFYLTGARVQRVSAEAAQVLHAQHEDLAVGLLRFTNGVIGVLIENWLSPAKVRDVIVNGERGMFVADFLTQDLYFYENNYTASGWEPLQVFRGMAEGRMIRYPLARSEPLRLELDAFARAVANGEPFLVRGEDGLLAMQLAQDLAETAARNGHG